MSHEEGRQNVPHDASTAFSLLESLPASVAVDWGDGGKAGLWSVRIRRMGQLGCTQRGIESVEGTLLEAARSAIAAARAVGILAQPEHAGTQWGQSQCARCGARPGLPDAFTCTGADGKQETVCRDCWSMPREAK